MLMRKDFFLEAQCLRPSRREDGSRGKPTSGQAGSGEYEMQSLGLCCPLACHLGPKWPFAVPHPLAAMFTFQNLRFLP